MTVVCIPITAKTLVKAARIIPVTRPDMIELRMDFLKTVDGLEKFFSVARVPVIATNRPRREGGFFTGPEEKRVSLLEKTLGKAKYVDIELSAPEKLRKKLVKKAKKAGTKVIVSFHDTRKTPEASVLKKILEEEKRAGADVAKIVTTAKSVGDNVKFIELYEYAKQKKIPLAAWAMGEPGRPSRYTAIVFGAPFVFASLKGMKSAPGQLTVDEAKEFIKALRH